MKDNKENKNKNNYKIVKILLIISVWFSFLFIGRILFGGIPSGGETSSHLDLLYNTAELIQNFDLTLWNPNYNTGFPMYFFYVPLPYLYTVLFSILTKIPLIFLYKIFVVLLYSSFPLVLYFSMRHMGYKPLACAIAAFFSPTILTMSKFGIEPFAFTGFGMYSQLFGLILIPPILAVLYNILVKTDKEKIMHYYQKNWLFIGVLLLTLLFFTHIISALMLCIMLIPLVILYLKKETIKRFILIMFFTFICISVIAIPIMLHGDNVKTDFEFNRKGVDGYGLEVFPLLLKGKFFDNSRMPILTLLVLAGLVYCLYKKKLKTWYPAMAFLFCIVLMIGKPVFGAMLDYIPFISKMELMRFVLFLNIFGLMVFGIASSKLIKKISLKNAQFKKYFIIMLIIIAIPLFLHSFFSNIQYKSYETIKPYSDAHYALEQLSNLPDGRIEVRQDHFGSKEFLAAAIPYLTGKPILVSRGIGAHDSPNTLFATMFINSPGFFDLFNAKYLLTTSVMKNKNGTANTPLYERGIYRIYNFSTTGYFDFVNVDTIINSSSKNARPILLTWFIPKMVKSKDHIIVSENVDLDDFDVDQSKNIINLNEALLKKEFAGAMQNRKKIRIDKNTFTINLNGQIIKSFPYFIKKQSKNISEMNCGNILKEKSARGRYAALINIENDNADSNCFLMLKASNTPEWKAYVDDKPVKIYEISPAFMAIKISDINDLDDINKQGRHKVLFEYKVANYRIVLFFISIAGLLLAYFIGRKLKTA